MKIAIEKSDAGFVSRWVDFCQKESIPHKIVDPCSNTIIADLAKEGKSIIMISSEMSELIGMSDRIMVMCDGRVTGFVNGQDATQENIMAYATQFE